ncbi:MAG: carboxypeptidase-like regulatory domain-containing protein [Gemmataceae bacterium]|nr:carboxypeptidase-like regulatory domain-containing protein [Gemmataceae bacterium]
MRALTAGLIAAGLVGLVGCGGSDYRSVSGTVLLDGEPVPDAAVAFVPEDPSGENATGYTDESGRFTMTSTRTDGVRPGKYKVRISAFAEKAEPVKGMAQIMAEKMSGGGGGDAKAAAKDANVALKAAAKDSKEANKRKRVSTPPVYNDIDKTPLRAEVPAQTTFKFELTRDAK